MDLLNMLMGTMANESSVSALSNKTGASSEQTSSLIGMALPMLMQGLTQNASSADGAQSLLNALGSHTNTSAFSSQIADVDEIDGGKIVNHIFGDRADSVISALSAKSGATKPQVTTILNSIAPAMMSGLSAATTSVQSNATSHNNGFDFSDLMSAFGGATQSQTQAASTTDLLGSLLGGSAQTQQQSSGLGGLLSGLLGGGSSSSSNAGGIGSLLGGLIDDGDGADDNMFNGNALLGALSSFMK